MAERRITLPEDAKESSERQASPTAQPADSEDCDNRPSVNSSNNRPSVYDGVKSWFSAMDQEEVNDLKTAHEKLKYTIRLRVHNALLEESTIGATAKSFGETSMGTVVGWITAQTFHYFILRFIVGGVRVDEKVRALISRVIYAVVASIVVPLVDVLLQRHKVENQFLADQVQLIKICLPMFFAWAWKDVVAAAFAVFGNAFWPECIVAAVLSLTLVAVHVSPCYHRAKSVAKAQPGGDTTLLARMPVMLGYFGLAVGFAWNAVLSWAPKYLVKYVHAPMFMFMIQFAYYLVITSVIIFVTSRWSKAVEAQAAKAKPDGKEEPEVDLEDLERKLDMDNLVEAGGKGQKDDKGQKNTKGKPDGTRQAPRIGPPDGLHPAGAIPGLKELGASTSFAGGSAAMAGELVVDTVGVVFSEIEEAGRSITLGSLQFVYAWAQLDTVNAMVFTYLLGCDGPTSCGYQYNFYFAVLVSVIFARASVVLKLEKRRTRWNIASTALMTKALSLNTGWAWANYTKTAIDMARRIEMIDSFWVYLLCMVFAWICISVLHRRFEVERRAWDRHCKEEAETYELILR